MADWRPSPEWEFESVVEHKRTSLRRLRAEFPELTWILVGDDGQHDPAIYDDFAAEHAVDVIAIRAPGTGQEVADPSSLRRVTGRDGRALLAALRDR